MNMHSRAIRKAATADRAMARLIGRDEALERSLARLRAHPGILPRPEERNNDGQWLKQARSRDGGAS